MGLFSASRRLAGGRQARRIIVAVLVVGGAVAVGLWATSPAWVAGLSEVTAAAWGWARTNLFTVTAAGLVISVAGLGVPFVLRRLERREATDQQRRARDRQVMLARVRHRWIAGVLDQSLANQVQIRLGLARRADAVWQPDMLLRRPGQPAQPLPAEASVSAVFDRLGGGLLMTGCSAGCFSVGLVYLRHLTIRGLLAVMAWLHGVTCVSLTTRPSSCSCVELAAVISLFIGCCSTIRRCGRGRRCHSRSSCQPEPEDTSAAPVKVRTTVTEKDQAADLLHNPEPMLLKPPMSHRGVAPNR